MIYEYDDIPFSLKEKYIGSGEFGRVYKTSDGKVYKQFKYPKYTHEHVIDMYYLGKSTPSDIFIFPEDLVFKNDLLIGYITKLINGYSFDYIRQEINLETLINELKRLEREVVTYSTLKVKLHDFHQGNLFMSDKDKIHVLDTDEFYYTDENVGITLERNLSQISFPIINGILDGQLSFEDKRLNYDKNTCFMGGILPSDYINEVINELNKYSEEEIKTVGDLQEGISLLLK